MEESPSDDSSVELAVRLAAGDVDAPQALFDRYVARLVAMVRTRLSPRLAQRIDPEDVTQSAFRSFFRRAARGELELGRAASLWRLLAAITHHKLLKQAEFHSARKRSAADEAHIGESAAQAHHLAADSEPDAGQATALADELEVWLASLDPLARRIVELRLADLSLEEVAGRVQRSERTVRRTLARIEEGLHRRLTERDD
jgi:RNA polymerase sigma factor (sigma-70 family)